MLSIEKPAARALARSCVDLGRVDRVPLHDPLLDGIDLFLDEAADLPLQLGDLGGKLGDDHGRPPGGRLTVRSGICGGSLAAREDLLGGTQAARERAVHQRAVRVVRVLAADMEGAGGGPRGGAGAVTE